MSVPRVLMAVALTAPLAIAACGDVNAALEELSQARHLVGDLEVAFTRASDASNRAVMADTDEASVRFAQEANAERQAVRDTVGKLRPLLETLRFGDEERILSEFEGRFAEYEKLDRQILDLAVENTNLKAQRLSFGEGQAAADAFRDALQALAPGRPADNWRLKATAAAALAAVREIQVLQAPHIADPDDASMTKTETRMKAEEVAARNAVAALAALVDSASRPKLAAVTDALDRFMGVNAQIVALSRRNTNVRSLALSLNQKPQLIPPCQQSLRALREALARRGFQKGRWG